MNCPYCNKPVLLARAGKKNIDSRSSYRVYQMTAPFMRYNGNYDNGAEMSSDDDNAIETRTEETWEPVNNATLRGQWATPLAISVTAAIGVYTVALPACLALELPKPLMVAYAPAWIAGALVWWNKQNYFASVIERHKKVTEKILNRDLDGDGYIGEPPPEVDNYIPVYHSQRVDAVDVPEPPERAKGDRQVLLRPSTRTIRKQVLWDYLWAAFESGDWTRDGNSHGGGCRGKGLNTKEWADVRSFVLRWDGVWETTDRPTLEAFLRNLGWTGPN